MNEDFAKKISNSAVAAAVPLPQREHYEITVSDQTPRALVLTSKGVSGWFEEVPVGGHVLRHRRQPQREHAHHAASGHGSPRDGQVSEARSVAAWGYGGRHGG
ncbi:hypothetical protein [Streptomyces lunalinharesii]